MGSLLLPRSALHAIPPIGLGTGAVESLTSYFCRLAYSHTVSATHLARWVQQQRGITAPAGYKWCQRNFVSTDEETQYWAANLSDLTGVGNLDQLTLLPWKGVISSLGIAPKSDRWCPHCLTEDFQASKQPYLRLLWEVAQVSVCPTHRVQLVHRCPHCARTNVRNRASLVVPGFCTHCGCFLGDAETKPAKDGALWVADQVALMLAHPPINGVDINVKAILETMGERLAGSSVSRLATMLEMSKSTIWNWLRAGGLPSLRSWLALSHKGGVPMEHLVCGELDGWGVPTETPQLKLDLPDSPRRGIVSRKHDWIQIRSRLQEILNDEKPYSLASVCEELGLDIKMVYLHANNEARAIAARYDAHQAKIRRLQEQSAVIRIQGVLHRRKQAGYSGMSARDIKDELEDSHLGKVRNVFHLIRTVKNDMDS